MKVDVFDNYTICYDKLLDYGFIKDDDSYLYKIKLDNDLYAIFKIKKDLYINVYDNDGEEYLPFNVKENYGSYVGEIKDKINNIKEDILSTCFIKNNLRDKILSYVHKKYKTKEEYPWTDTPKYYTLKVNNKWYLIYMNVKYKILGLNKDGIADIINVKLDPIMIEKLIDNKTYFKAYHMNKKYWLTILLDNNIDFEIVCSLIDQSFEIVSKR